MTAFGSPEFWALYDTFVSQEHIDTLVEDAAYPGVSPVVSQMREITRAAHETGHIHNLSRSERGWLHHNAWLTLQRTEIQRDDGQYAGLLMRAGDVIVVEHQWDRDVLITHVPIQGNIVSGYLLSGRWDPMVGLFLPLFDKRTIFRCIEARMRKNVEEMRSQAQKEAGDWEWY